MVQLGPSRIVCYMKAMSTQVNIATAKAKLSELVARAEAGEEVVIARGGKPAVKLTVVHAPAEKRQPRKLGILDHLGLDIDDKLFLERDMELEALMDEPLWPEE